MPFKNRSIDINRFNNAHFCHILSVLDHYVMLWLHCHYLSSLNVNYQSVAPQHLRCTKCSCLKVALISNSAMILIWANYHFICCRIRVATSFINQFFVVFHVFHNGFHARGVHDHVNCIWIVDFMSTVNTFNAILLIA